MAIVAHVPVGNVLHERRAGAPTRPSTILRRVPVQKGVPGILVGGLLDLGLYFADVQNDVLGLWMGMSRLVVAVLDGGLAWLYMLLMSYMVICES